MTISFPDVDVPPSSTGRITLWPLPELPRSRPAEAPSLPAPDPDASAYARGWAEGEEAARAEGDRRVREALALLETASAAVAELRADLTRDFRDQLHALSLAIARHLVLREVEADPDIMRALVARAVELVPSPTTIRMHLHPDDLAALASWRRDFPSGGHTMEWVADPETERGGCRVETPHRLIDGRLDQSLVALFDRMRHV